MATASAPSIRAHLPFTGRLGLVMVLFLLFAALAGPSLLQDPQAQDLMHALEGPSAAHWLGTDQLGRDLLARIVIGARLSLLIGVGATLFGLVIGTALGMSAGYFGGVWEAAIMRLVDLLLVFPGILIALMVIAVAGDGIPNVILAVGLRAVPVFARLAQTSTQALREREYVIAAKAAGASSGRIILAHVLPALVNSLLVMGALQIATSILIGATLSFLGIGVSPELPEWGAMLNAGRRYLFQHEVLIIFPGLAIMLTVLAVNLLGDGLRTAFDPKRGRGGMAT
jgi:ABC-type dipeptide/oligopeptide/nickel transport system permease subunit